MLALESRCVSLRGKSISRANEADSLQGKSMSQANEADSLQDGKCPRQIDNRG